MNFTKAFAAMSLAALMGTGLASAQSCPGNAFLSHLGKNRLMVGMMPEEHDLFSWQNPALVDVRYIYIADAVPVTDQSPATCAQNPQSRWWGCWSQPTGRHLTRFLELTERAQQIPMITYYTWAQTVGEGNPAQGLQNANFLRAYFNDWRFLLGLVGNRKVIIHSEPDLWGYFQQSQGGNNMPSAVQAADIAAASQNDCVGDDFPNTLVGFSRCIIHMTRKYAPNALIGLHASFWSHWNQNAQIQGQYLHELGADRTDFMTYEASDRDARFWLMQGRTDTWFYWPAEQDFTNYFNWAATLNSVDKKPMVWWQIPLGNETQPNTPANDFVPQYERRGYWDNRVDYFLTHGDALAARGFVLMAFGRGEGRQTNPLSDGGNFVRRTIAYKQSNQGFNICGRP